MGVKKISFDLFLPYKNLLQGTFLRLGGVSLPPFDSLNGCARSGDLPQAVAENRKLVSEALGIEKLVFLKQEHGIQMVQIPGGEDQAADASFTTKLGVGLVITHADCQAAIFFDPIRQVIAAAHAGWRGVVQNIYGHVIQQLKEKTECKAQDLLVAISPSLCGLCHERKAYKEELPQSFWKEQLAPNHFDFRKIAKKQLLKAGILEKHLEISPECTYCDPTRFFSYRREKKTGRLMTVIAMKEPLSTK